MTNPNGPSYTPQTANHRHRLFFRYGHPTATSTARMTDSLTSRYYPHLHSDHASSTSSAPCGFPPFHPHQSHLYALQGNSSFGSFPSETSAISAESPLSVSSGNDSPLPEPAIENMEPNVFTRDASGNEETFVFPSTDDLFSSGQFSGYAAPSNVFSHNYALDNLNAYNQGTSPPVMPVSMAMSTPLPMDIKKYPPLYQGPQAFLSDDVGLSQPLGCSPYDPPHVSSTAFTNLTAPSRIDPQFYRRQSDSRVAYNSQLPNASAPAQPRYPHIGNVALKSGVDNVSHVNVSASQVNPTYRSYTSSLECALTPVTSSGRGEAQWPNPQPPLTTDAQPSVGSSSPDLAMALMQNRSLAAPSSASTAPISAQIPRSVTFASPPLAPRGEQSVDQSLNQQQLQHPQPLRIQTLQPDHPRTVRLEEISPTLESGDLPDNQEDDSICNPGESIRIGSTGIKDGERVDRAEEQLGDDDAEGEDEVSDDEDEYRAEEEGDEDGDDDRDADFIPGRRITRAHTMPSRSGSGRNARFNPYGMQLGPSARKAHSPASSISSHTAPRLSPKASSSQRPRRNSRTLPVPIPVPNLTKKSRGRRVPTVNNGGIKREDDRQSGEHPGARSFTCEVPGCGKCFARGEHLKRHVRSIHTNEKPHKCPHLGCDKEFSRHDNLGQHLKTHKGGR